MTNATKMLTKQTYEISTNVAYYKRRLSPTGKSHEVWMMMMIAASLMWAGAAERERECEQPKLALKS